MTRDAAKIDRRGGVLEKYKIAFGHVKFEPDLNSSHFCFELAKGHVTLVPRE